MIFSPRPANPKSTQVRLAAMVLCLTWPTQVSAAEEWQGKVVAVADGDTITVLHDKTPTKIRLQAIDCPEKAQPFGSRAKAFTSDLVFGKVVTIKVATRDRYHRTVAWVELGGRSLNKELLKAGLAWWYRKYAPKEKALAALEQEARAAKRGLWADAQPTPPWEWRHAKKDPHPAAAPASAPAPSAKYHGNTKSKVFHRAGCKGYDCQHCTAGFQTSDQGGLQALRDVPPVMRQVGPRRAMMPQA